MTSWPTKSKKKNDFIDFKTLLKIDNNPLKIDYLNYKKQKALIRLKGSRNEKKEILIKNLSIDEKKNQIQIKNLRLNKKLKIIELGTINLDYIDNENQKNQIRLSPIKDGYILDGPFFNANKFIDDLLSDNSNASYFDINTKIKINIDRVRLDNQNSLFNLNGNLFTNTANLYLVFLL
mgnify:CR=1 FL=1